MARCLVNVIWFLLVAHPVGFGMTVQSECKSSDGVLAETLLRRGQAQNGKLAHGRCPASYPMRRALVRYGASTYSRAGGKVGHMQ
jgi:hypothetical protein